MRTEKCKGCKTDSRGNTEGDGMEKLDGRSWVLEGGEPKALNRLQTVTNTNYVHHHIVKHNLSKIYYLKVLTH